jgi:hypothetical protein
MRNISIIQCYAPTERGLKNKKTNKVPREKRRKRDIVILMGDMSAKLGGEDESLKHIMGKTWSWKPKSKWGIICISVC